MTHSYCFCLSLVAILFAIYAIWTCHSKPESMVNPVAYVPTYTALARSLKASR